MFLSEHGSRLSARAVQHLVHKWCLNPQRGTDSCAPAQALVRDQDGERRYVLPVLRELMGHSSFTTTQRYFRIRPERLATEYFAAMEFINAK
jgi:site-specific recombinase XerC